jgi:putative oxidoreductase
MASTATAMSRSDARSGSTASGFDVVLLISRILLVAIFPVSAYFKIIQWPGIVTMLTQQGAPLPLVGGILAVIAELLGAVLVAIGLWTRAGAILLILYVVGTTIIAHRFWEFAPPAQFGQLMSFFKNLCMIGGLMLIAALGPGRFAVQPRP